MKKNIGKINKYLFIYIILLYLHNNKLYCMGNISNKDKSKKIN